MIKPYFIRSTLFNLCFFIIVGIACFMFLPTLILPRKYYMAVVYWFVYTTALLEKHILGLSYEIRGHENLPDSGPYIIASKHESAYETFKLHILFKDPAIVLKKELLKIPLWGKYLEKSDVIAIDRSTPKEAVRSIQEGAQRVKEQGRPILIFPQGTRVTPETTTKEKPYKIGIIRIQEATNLPIIPMALNTGVFYPKTGWCKKPGKIVFEFLPPLKPNTEIDAGAKLKMLESSLEEKSAQLAEEGKAQLSDKKKRPAKAVIITLLIVFSAYTAYWFAAAHFVQKAITETLAELRNGQHIQEVIGESPSVSGFPGEIQLFLPKHVVKTARETITIDTIQAESWPALGMPITFKTGEIHINMPHWRGDLIFDHATGVLTHLQDTLTIDEFMLSRDDTTGTLSGTILLSKPHPVLDLKIAITNYNFFLLELVSKKIVKEKPAGFAAMALSLLQRDGVVKSNVVSQGNKVYLGPIKIFEFPDNSNAALLENGQPSAFATKRVKPVPGQ